MNQAPIAGESVPVDKAPGDPVFAGSVNGEGALVIDVTAAIGDRTLDRVIKLVSEAQTQKAPTQQFTERFARVFVPVVLIGDVLLIVVPRFSECSRGPKRLPAPWRYWWLPRRVRWHSAHRPRSLRASLRRPATAF